MEPPLKGRGNRIQFISKKGAPLNLWDHTPLFGSQTPYWKYRARSKIFCSFFADSMLLNCCLGHTLLFSFESLSPPALQPPQSTIAGHRARKLTPTCSFKKDGQSNTGDPWRCTTCKKLHILSDSASLAYARARLQKLSFLVPPLRQQCFSGCCRPRPGAFWQSLLKACLEQGK